MTFGRQRRGFTMIEVLIASAIVAMISAGLLATTWRLSRWAHEQVDLLAADAICQDYVNVMYGLAYHRIESKSNLTLRDQVLPIIEKRERDGSVTTKRLLRPSDAFTSPVCDIAVTKVMKDGVESKKIVVSVRWQVAPGKWVATPHSVELIRSQADRVKKEAGS